MLLNLRYLGSLRTARIAYKHLVWPASRFIAEVALRIAQQGQARGVYSTTATRSALFFLGDHFTQRSTRRRTSRTLDSKRRLLGQGRRCCSLLMGHCEHLLLSVRRICSRCYKGESRGSNGSGGGDLTTVDSCSGDFILWGSQVMVLFGTQLLGSGDDMFTIFSCSCNISQVLLVLIKGLRLSEICFGQCNRFVNERRRWCCSYNISSRWVVTLSELGLVDELEYVVSQGGCCYCSGLWLHAGLSECRVVDQRFLIRL